ncbi:cation:proton antiporter domain-containing protein [Variovorax arabinosiphilus]|uniref:cation:proton antiporter domain-containing protein n=1 Tax=Variovorax arabinosiphilus TaxID=3053498 RepID=UPI0025774627|nr:MULTISPECIES: cation:proton antiporter [unclassified Variovorax]MDM0121413.1 cation:proton antiporter [Variovorax sp. J2L1-78]MDM0130474.1 cation:proton antiporter [Variovorax sp. J2L1-63]MDM0234176.1 cation:proton antiporter [Variovorax sp. J2R1-6]
MTLALLLLQLTVILVVARGCGLLLRAFGQPMVIGEMTAGILLGPIVFGALFPAWHAQLFPPASLQGLSSLASLGIVLFMFVVGAELRSPSGMAAQVKSAGWVGVCSMLLPMVLGLAIAPVLHPTLAPAGLPFWPFALFLGVALSITAFPVLARILKDRHMTRTPVGQLALGAAGVVDSLAWVLLALVVAFASSGAGLAGFMRISLGLAVLVAVIFLVVKPLVARMLRVHAPGGVPSPTVLATLMIGLFACAMVTEWLHLHAVFGAFLFGLSLPRDDRLLKHLVERLEPLSIIVLMPIFFALAGLGTTSGAFAHAGLGAMALILVVASVGKIAGGAAGARVSGYGWRDSLATGALMNSRGLMELIVIKVGLDAGLIGPELFTMLLVMALVTTASTGPLLSLIARPSHDATADGARRA